MFQGFTPETFDFLWGIRMNNNRDWFQSHKQQYLDSLYNPMKALGQELFTPFADRPGAVLKVSRIYRDARLHHPDPYKESLWICIRQDAEWWAENPCLYFELSPEGADCGFVLWQPRVSRMEAFRRAIAAAPEEFPALVEKVQADTGLPVTAEVYKRPKATEHPALEPYFAWKRNISCARSLEPGKALFTPALSQEVRELFIHLLPLYDYFNKLPGEA